MASLENDILQEQSHQRPLPTPRTFLTSLFTSLSATTNPSASAAKGEPKATQKEQAHEVPPSNPFLSLPSSKKSLLATLHVLFPPPTLLQALDLLDRGLVTRISVVSNAELDINLKQDEDKNENPLAHEHANPGPRKDRPEKGATEIKTEREKSFFSVRSAQSRRSHPRHAGDTSSPSLGSSSTSAGGGLVYTVRLRAWSCDCAAFAFSAFPPTEAHPYEDEEEDSSLEEEPYEEVGGLSLNGRGKGRGDEGVPVCKHLIACLLAERWEEVFGGYVKEKRVGREEAAGICAA